MMKYEQEKNKIIELLKYFQEGYDKKTIENVDTYVNHLFDIDNFLIIGTSGGELCLNYEEGKKLFINDWNGWGFEKINIDEAIINIYDNMAFVYADASFSSTFTYYDKDYERFSSMLIDTINNNDDNRSLKVKLTDENWVLSFLMQGFENVERTLSTDLRLSFILIKINDEYKIRQLQFSVNLQDRYPESRLFEGSYFNREYEHDLNKLINYPKKNNTDSVNSFIQEFTADYFNNNIDIIEKYFNNEFIVLNVDKNIAKNTEDLEKVINRHRDIYKSLKIEKNSIINISNNFATFVSIGTFNNTIDEEEYLKYTTEELRQIHSESIDDKAKLFKYRRAMTTAFKEIAIGNDYTYPIRFEALLERVNNEWKFNYIQFSYPYCYILDNKNEYMKLISSK